MKRTFHAFKPALSILACVLIVSCQSTSMFRLGSQDKKQRLVGLVQRTRDAQVEANEEFAQAFDLFTQMTQHETEDLELLSENLVEELEDCQDAAEALRDHIEDVENQAADLFEEWGAELEEFSSPTLRGKSEALLVQTHERFQRLLTDLRGTDAGMEPVLVSFRDYVLFFNHNLNPMAIATLEDTLPVFVESISDLRKEIESDVAEADSFIQFVEGRMISSSHPEIPDETDS